MKSKWSRPSGRNAIVVKRRLKQCPRGKSKTTQGLSRLAAELSATNRQMQRGIVRSKAIENPFEKSGKHRDKRLQESLQLQKELRQLTHQALMAQEDDRKKISCGLQDEIAQTLLGINVRLLTLKREGRHNAKGFKNEIAKAQRLVLKSAQSARRFALELDTHSQSKKNGLSRRSRTASRRASRRRGHG